MLQLTCISTKGFLPEQQEMKAWNYLVDHKCHEMNMNHNTESQVLNDSKYGMFTYIWVGFLRGNEGT